MNIKIISFLINICFIIVPILAYRLIRIIIKEFNYVKVRDRFYEEVSEKLKENKLSYFNKERIEKFLKKNGINEGLTPEQFILIKLFLAILGLIVISKEVSILVGLGSAIFLFFLLDIAIHISNKSQDTDIIIELANVCDSLRIQLKGGVHITNALTECYLICRNKRLKRAFEKVETSLYLEHDLEKSLLDFQESFNNKYINSFVVTILQSEKTGKINQSMKDLSDSFSDIAKVVDNKKEKAINRKIEILTISIVVWIIGAAGYAIVMYLIENSKNIWR